MSKNINLDLLDQNLTKVQPRYVSADGQSSHLDLIQAFYQAAAVLYWFDPRLIEPFNYPKPVSDKERTQVLGHLSEYCTIGYNETGKLVWYLKSDARKRGLKALKTTRKLRAALKHTENRPSDFQQALIEDFINKSNLNL